MLTQFFCDAKGKPSSMRLMSFVSLLIGGALAILPVFGFEPGPSEHVLYFLGGAFGGKAYQKHTEGKVSPGTQQGET